MAKILSKIMIVAANGTLMFSPLASFQVKSNLLMEKGCAFTPIKTKEKQDFVRVEVDMKPEKEKPIEELPEEVEVVGDDKPQANSVNYSSVWSGQVLNPSLGTIQGPSGKETYYNLDMSGCIASMRTLGYDEVNYAYWVRDDGAKMLGPYIMIAANYSIRPKGTLVETSMGTGIVVDTGKFANTDPYQIDIATTW